MTKNITKELEGVDIRLSLKENGSTYLIKAKPSNSRSLFSSYGGNSVEMKSDLEDLCDEWVEELELPISYSQTQPNYSFLADEIFIVREYS